MKKIILSFAVLSLFSCKKETATTTQNTTVSDTTNTKTDTTNTTTNTDTKSINFKSIGTAIGTFGSGVKDVDGNSYKTVVISNKEWMAENLKVTKYNDRTPIPNVKTGWSSLQTGAWVHYFNKDTMNTKYGKLYNWFAVSPTTNGNKNICPTGWHVPSDVEWENLIAFLGGKEVAGGKMKEIGTVNWMTPNTEATNTSLFTAVPGGLYLDLGSFMLYKGSANWWSSTENDPGYVWSRRVFYDSQSIDRGYTIKSNGLSIRCVKD